MDNIHLLERRKLSATPKSRTADVEPNTNSFGKLLQEGSNPTLDNERDLV